MSLNKYYKEKDYVEGLLKKRSFDVGAKGDLKVLAKYYKSQGFSYKDIESKLYEFANTKGKKWFKNVVHFKLIDSAVNFTRKKDNILVQIDKVDVYKVELDYIESLPYSYIEKKILFAMLVINKLKQEKTKLKGMDVNYDINYFGGGSFGYKTMLDSLQEKLTRTFCDKEIHKVIKKFNDDGLTRTSKTTSLELLYLKNINYEDTDEVVLEIEDFDRLGLYYDYHNNKIKSVKCIIVGCENYVFKLNNYTKYCEQCAYKERLKRQLSYMKKKV